jgi:hypothetical protein
VPTGAPNGFTISPVLNEITVAKGQSQNIPITVSNPTSGTITAQPVVNDFLASADESGTPRLILNPKAPLPANNFKSLVGNIPTTVIGPDQNKIIDVTIAVPKNAFSGGYYGAVRFVPGGTSNPNANVGLTASVGSLFLVTVPGNLTSQINIVQLAASDANGNPSSLFTNGQVSALLRLQDTGNIYAQPFGTIVVKNMLGHIISTTQFNNITPKYSVLPQSIRKFIIALPHHNYLGHYTITASLGYGTAGNNLIVETVGFWYIPIWLQVIGLIVVIAIVTIIYLIVHKLRSRRFKKV